RRRRSTPLFPYTALFRSAVAAESTGALPEHAVRQWLGEHLPSPARKHLQAAQEALAAGDRPAARDAFEAVLADESEGPTAEEARDRKSTRLNSSHVKISS